MQRPFQPRLPWEWIIFAFRQPYPDAASNNLKLKIKNTVFNHFKLKIKKPHPATSNNLKSNILNPTLQPQTIWNTKFKKNHRAPASNNLKFKTHPAASNNLDVRYKNVKIWNAFDSQKKRLPTFFFWTWIRNSTKELHHWPRPILFLKIEDYLAE